MQFPLTNLVVASNAVVMTMRKKKPENPSKNRQIESTSYVFINEKLIASITSRSHHELKNNRNCLGGVCCPAIRRCRHLRKRYQKIPWDGLVRSTRRSWAIRARAVAVFHFAWLRRLQASRADGRRAPERRLSSSKTRCSLQPRSRRSVRNSRCPDIHLS